MSTKLFNDACGALWGPVYQSTAARELGISRISAVRYSTGEREVPSAVLDQLQRLAGKRLIELGMIHHRLIRKAAAS